MSASFLASVVFPAQQEPMTAILGATSATSYRWVPSRKIGGPEPLTGRRGFGTKPRIVTRRPSRASESATRRRSMRSRFRPRYANEASRFTLPKLLSY